MRYYITVFPGIEEVAKEEILAKFYKAKVHNIVKSKNNSLVFFEFKGDISELFDIKTAEDLYVDLGVLNLNSNKKDLVFLDRFIKNLQTLDPALHTHRQINNKKSKNTTFRVIAQTESDPKAYRRVDTQKVAERAIANKYNKKWKIVDDNSQLEFWLHLIKNKAYLGLRLSDSRMRHRTYKLDHIPASLRPTVAYSLVWLSNIQEEDVFLDPMCGAGTILIERANAGRYQELLGGDINKDTVEVALNNIGNKYKPITIKNWDATKLPLTDNSVDKIVSNLPFGKQIGSHEENKVLYNDFFIEANRVLKQGGRMVFLTSEFTLIKDQLEAFDNLKLIKHYKNIKLLGCYADIFVIDKK